MFDKLIDLVVQFLEFFRFCTIIDIYERGVRLRLGKYQKTLEPGFHWLIPFNVDNVLTDGVTPRLYELVAKSLVTSDGKAIAAGITITAQIRSIEKALLEVENVEMAIQDASKATLAEHVAQTTWEGLRTEEFTSKLTAACRKLAFRYGIEIMSVRLHELAPLRTFRLIGSN